MNMKFHRRLCSILLLLLFTFYGCQQKIYIADQEPSTPYPQLNRQSTHDSSYYISESNQVAPNDRLDYLQQASFLLLAQGRGDEAAQILTTIDTENAPLYLQQRQFVLVRLHALENNDMNKALELVTTDLTFDDQYQSKNILTKNWLLFGWAKIAQTQNKPFTAFDYYNQRYDFINADEINENNTFIWNLLTEQSLEDLKQAQLKINDARKSPWVDLAFQYKTYALSYPDTWQKLIEQWQYTYPKHPANGEFIENLTNSAINTIRVPDTVGNIALLLPLSSNFSPVALAIEQGIKDAMLAKQQTINITTYDYSQGQNSIQDVYTLAANQGADVIIGPLGNTATIELLSNEFKLEKPTLLLGQPDTSLDQHVLSFTLNPDKEAIEVATFANQQGYKSALILYPDSSQGNRLKEAFINQWQLQEGVIAGVTEYESDFYDPTKPIEKLISQSSRRADFIFFAGNNKQARLLIPAIQVRSKTPIIATSSIYGGRSNSAEDFSLNGVRFCDMSWMIGTEGESLHRDYPSQWAHHYTPLDRFYAYGIDAYQVAINIVPLIKQPQQRLNGVTGELTINNQIINHQLNWFKFSDGLPTKISP